MNTLPDTTVEPVETPTAEPTKAPAQCKLCRDGTYATKTMQSFVDDISPWEPYCDPCAVAFASVLKDAQGRDAEIRLLPVPPKGKAAPKPPRPKVEPIPKPTKGSKGAKALPAKVADAPASPAPVDVPKPPVEVRRMSLAEAMRPTAPRPAPAVVVPPPAPPPPPVSAKNAKKALQDAARDVEGGYDLLTMLGMKR